MKKIILFLCLIGGFIQSNGSTVQLNLYLNQGIHNQLDTFSMSYLAINTTDTFSYNSAIVRLSIGDSLHLKLHNQTATNQSFKLGSHANFSLDAGDSITVSELFLTEEVFQLFSDLNYPDYKNAGAAAMFVVSSKSQASFYWNLQEQSSSFNDSILNGGSPVNWQDYYPNVFTVNGNSKPLINSDPQARVTGSVGDTLYIFIANSGQAAHSLHFHGYHAEIVYSNSHAEYIGRSKDTFPLLSMETMILELIPHQPGEYPVHDHNLVAVSGNGIYPNGMFLTMLVQ